MRIHKVPYAVESVTFIIGLMSLAGMANAETRAFPGLKLGPQAIQSGVVGANYGLFTCQVVGLDPGTTCYDPYQIRHAYQIDTLINAGFTGKGKTIVVIDAFQNPNLVTQLNTQDSFYGLPGMNGLGNPPDPTLGTFTQVAPDGLTPFVVGDPDMTGWAEEISLDVMWAHAMAPNANIVLVLSKSDSDADILSATKYAVDHNLGNVISQSFGENESCMASNLLVQEALVFAEATLKGITLFASTGDEGAGQPTCDGSALVKAVSVPASNPLVTAVGGTELHAARYCLTSLGCNPAANRLPGTYQGEIAWNEPQTGATGGGFSIIFDTPFFQEGTVHGKQRGLPDVAYSAAVEHGLLTYLDIPGVPSGFYLFGGTSAGSPQWAAILSIADQKAGHNLGFINRGLYYIGQTPHLYSASLNDVTSGNNSFGGVTGFSAGPGWDATTGLGSPSAADLVGYLIQFVTPLDGLSALPANAPFTQGNPSAPGRLGPH